METYNMPTYREQAVQLFQDSFPVFEQEYVAAILSSLCDIALDSREEEPLQCNERKYESQKLDVTVVGDQA